MLLSLLQLDEQISYKLQEKGVRYILVRSATKYQDGKHFRVCRCYLVSFLCSRSLCLTVSEMKIDLNWFLFFLFFGYNICGQIKGEHNGYLLMLFHYSSDKQLWVNNFISFPQWCQITWLSWVAHCPTLHDIDKGNQHKFVNLKFSMWNKFHRSESLKVLDGWTRVKYFFYHFATVTLPTFISSAALCRTSILIDSTFYLVDGWVLLVLLL